MPRRALITGITGQDGSYLAELLLAKGEAFRKSFVFNSLRARKVPTIFTSTADLTTAVVTGACLHATSRQVSLSRRGVG